MLKSSNPGGITTQHVHKHTYRSPHLCRVAIADAFGFLWAPLGLGAHWVGFPLQSVWTPASQAKLCHFDGHLVLVLFQQNVVS